MTAAANQDANILPPGTRLGSYEVVRHLGAGGMGSVYEVRHTSLGKRAAIKTLHRQFALDAQICARFMNEGKAAAAIEHPHVVDVHDVGTEGETPFLVMDFLEGSDLAGLLQQEGPLDPTRIADILVPVCSALGAAHDLGVVHRDLKPENIFLQRTSTLSPTPKVLDFGVSKLDGPEDSLVKTGTQQLLGTPFYMSPEQARSSKHVDARSDIWSLGVILYELSTGQRPFQSDVLFELLTKIVSEPPVPPRSLRTDLPEAFASVVLRALHKDAAARHQSARELGAELLPFASQGIVARFNPEMSGATSAPQQLGLAATTPHPAAMTPVISEVREKPSEPPAASAAMKVPSSSRGLWLGLGIGAVVVGGVVAAVALSGGSETPAPQAAEAPVAAAVEPTEPARMSTFDVHVEVTPAGAAFQLDDESPSPGVDGRFMRHLIVDGATHHLRISMEGYETETLSFADSPPPERVTLRPLPEHEVEAMRAVSRASRMHARMQETTAAPAPMTEAPAPPAPMAEMVSAMPPAMQPPTHGVQSDGTTTL